MIPGSANPLLLGQTSSGGGDFSIDRSLRFNAPDSSFLNRTPSSAGNRKTWTWSGWVKRSSNTQTALFHAGSSNQTVLWFDGNNLEWTYYAGGYGARLRSSALFRDFSAWMHVVFVLDTTQATADSRMRMYINGAELTDFAARTNPSQNADYNVNNTVAHEVGRNNVAGGYNFNGYLAEVNFIDGQALAPTDFGETDDNGVWQAKEFAGSYTLPASGSGIVYSSLVSGSVAGSPYDSTKMFDGSLTTYTDHGSANSNITWTYTLTSVTSLRVYIHGGNSTNTVTTVGGSGTQTDTISTNFGPGWHTISLSSTGSTINSIAFTRGGSGNPLSVYAIEVNGTVLVDGTPAQGANSFRLSFADNSSNAALGTDSSGNSNTWTVNNLSASAPGLATANQGMDVVTYTGTGSAQSIGGLAFQPDFVWLKRRSATGDHCLSDSVRGFGASGSSKLIYTNATNSEDTGNTQIITAFNSDGFTLGTNGLINGSGSTHVAWCWKAGGAAVSNTDGTITSQVSASTDYGFSVTSYTGNNTAGATVGHGLGSAVKFLIVKSRGQSGQYWHVWHSSLANNEYIYLNASNAKTSGNDFLNGTAPGSSTFTLGSGNACNKSSDPVIAYAWSEIAGFSKFGSYTGTGAAGVVVTTGFKPRFILIKNVSTGSDWRIFDTARSPSNPADKLLFPNATDAEKTNSDYNTDITATGFTVNGTHSGLNTNGDTYIYAAYASKPSGEGIDSLRDSPSNAATPTDTGAGGEVVGNYATLNPLRKHADSGAAGHTLANGNLDITATAGACGAGGTIGMSGSGKYYWEVTYKTGTEFFAGIIDAASETKFLNAYTGWTHYGHLWGPKNSVFFDWTGGGAASTSISSAVSDGDIMGIALDLDNNSLQYYKNGAAVGSARSVTAGKTWTAWIASGNNTYNNLTCSVNFGQRSFSHSAPTNFKSLNTANLPTPTIADGSKYFDTKLFTGNGGTNAQTGLGFSPDLLWFKIRSQAFNHNLFDSVRGNTKHLSSNLTNAEYTESSGRGLTAFDSNGFTLGQDVQGPGSVNASGQTYVGWAWDAGTSTVTNNDGSIASQVRASAASGFSIVSYTGTGAAATFGHGLNAAPEMVIIKQRNGTGFWVVGHKDFPFTSDYYMVLNTSDAVATGASGIAWQSTAPTSSVVSIGSSSVLNGSGNTHVAYCFAPVAGYSAMGSYTGNGSTTNPPFVYLGFKPAFLVIKKTNGGAHWIINDSTRNPSNVADNILRANESGAEYVSTSVCADLLSNGFKLRSGVIDQDTNGSGGEYIYLAFASNPFQANGGLAR